MPAENNDLRARFAREFSQLKILPGKDADLTRAIADLFLLAQHDPSGDDKVRRAFRACETSVAAKELKEISRRAEKLAIALDDPSRRVTRARQQLALRLDAMHQTTIDALANGPCLKIGPHSDIARLDVGYARTHLPSILRAEEIDRQRLSSGLRWLARVVSMAKPKKSKDAGRSTDRFAHAIGESLPFTIKGSPGSGRRSLSIPQFNIYQKPLIHAVHFSTSSLTSFLRCILKRTRFMSRGPHKSI